MYRKTSVVVKAQRKVRHLGVLAERREYTIDVELGVGNDHADVHRFDNWQCSPTKETRPIQHIFFTKVVVVACGQRQFT